METKLSDSNEIYQSMLKTNHEAHEHLQEVMARESSLKESRNTVFKEKIKLDGEVSVVFFSPCNI